MSLVEVAHLRAVESGRLCPELCSAALVRASRLPRVASFPGTTDSCGTSPWARRLRASAARYYVWPSSGVIEAGGGSGVTGAGRVDAHQVDGMSLPPLV